MVKKFVGTLLVFTYLLSLPIHAFAIDGDGEPKSIKKPVSYMIVNTQHDSHFIFNN